MTKTLWKDINCGVGEAGSTVWFFLNVAMKKDVNGRQNSNERSEGSDPNFGSQRFDYGACVIVRFLRIWDEDSERGWIPIGRIIENF